MNAAVPISKTPAAAQAYVKAGFVLVPFDRGSKGPKVKGWNLRENCIDTIEAAANLFGNIGVALAYSRMVVIDIDDMPLAVAWFAGAGIDLVALWNAPDAVRWTSGRLNRGKILYRLPPGTPLLRTRSFSADGVELRCATATGLTVQDVLPPSIHPETGKPYTWLGPGTYHDVPVIPPDLSAFWLALTARHDDDSSRKPIGIGREDIEARLDRITAEDCDYDEWLSVGFALHHETGGSDVGQELWEQWSFADGKNKKYNPGRANFDGRYNSFSLDHENPITLRSLEWLSTPPDMADEMSVIADDPVRAAGGDVIDFATLAVTPPPPRRWVRDEWLPRKLTLLGGAAGTGKSLIAQQLQTSLPNGLPWLGIPGIQGPTLGIYCEDDEDELRRRQATIFDANGLDPVKHSAGIHVQSRVGRDNLLFTFDTRRRLKRTAFYDELHAMLERFRPVLLVLDNSAQMYNGSEIDRPMVTAYCNGLSGLSLKFDLAVALLAHPAKADGSEFSGSTAWDAAVRTRLYLQRNGDGATYTLKKAKANYSKLEDIDLEYRHGIFVARTPADVSQDVALAEPVVLAALEHLTRRQTNTSHRPTAQNNLIKIADREGLLNGTSKQLGDAALSKLITSGAIVPNVTMPWRDSTRHQPLGLATAALAIETAAAKEAQAATRKAAKAAR
jgi:hypothetical protein